MLKNNEDNNKNKKKIVIANSISFKLVIWMLVFLTGISFVNAFTFNETHIYGFNENGQDSVVGLGGLNLTETSITYTTALKEGNASAVFNGASSRFTNDSMSTNWTYLTVNCWINLTRSLNTDTVYSQDMAAAGANVHMTFDGDGVSTTYMATHMPADTSASTGNFSNLSYFNTSHMYTWVVGFSDKSHFYIDGAEQAKSTDGIAGTGTLNSQMCFGNQIGDAGSCGQGGWFNGTMDDCRIWTRNFTNQDVTDLYNNYTDTVTSDTTIPTFDNNATNNTAPKINEAFNMSINVSDETALSHYLFAWDNGTGTFVNDTAVPFPASTTEMNRNVTKTIQRASGTTMQWRWYANDTTNNWNQSTTYSVVVADTAGTFTTNTTNNTAPKINEAINFSITLTDADTLIGYQFSWDNGTGTFVNDSFIAITGTTQNINTTKTIQRVSGTTMQWRWHMNDTAGNYYTSTTYGVVVADTAGTFTSNTTNNTAPKINQNVNFSIVLTDADTLSYRIFSYDNGTGTYVNDSAVLISGTTFNANVTKTIQRIRGVTIQWRWFSNDTANNYYASTIESFIVQDTSPTAPTVTAITPATVYANDTLNSGASGSTDADGDTIYYYIKWNTSVGVTLRDFTNASGFDSFNCATDQNCNKSITVTAFARAITLVSGTTNSSDASASKAISNYVPTITFDKPAAGEHINKNGSASNEFNFSFYPYDTDIGKGDTVSCSVFINSSGGLVANISVGSNSSVTSGNLSRINLTTAISDNQYVWFANCTDGTGTGNTSTRTVVFDADMPDITWTFPALANTTRINSTTLNLNIQCADTNIERVNMTLAHAGNSTIVKSNLTTNITSSPFVQNDSISLSGQNNGNYTIEMSCADDISGSPNQPNYHAQKPFFYKTEYADNVSNTNFSMYFEITNPALKEVSLASKDLQINTTEDGKHIRTSWCVNVSPAQKVRHVYVTNNDKKFNIRNLSTGHFIIGDKFVHYKEDLAAGYSISVNEVAVNNQSEVHVYLWKESGWDGRQCTSSAVTGGLNTQTETTLLVMDTVPPFFTNNQTNDTSVLKDEAMQFNITITDTSSNVAGFIFSWDNGTATFVNDSFRAVSGSNTTVSVNKTVDRTRGITLQWKWYSNDTVSLWNESTTYQITVADSATAFTSNVTNDTNPLKNEVLQMNITITDSDNISGFIFAWDNGTNSFANDSFRSTSNSITTLVASINKTIERTNGTTLTWKFYSNDSSGTWNSSGNFTVIVGNSPPSATTLISPGNAANQSSIPINLTYNTSRELDADNNTLTFYIYINGTINRTAGTIESNFSFNASDGDYNWSVVVSDGVTNSSNSSTRTFILDSTAPTINLTSPSNTSSFSVSTVTFYYNVTDLHGIDNCSLWVEQSSGFSIRSTNTSPNKGVNSSFTRAGLENGNHYWMIQCVDESFNNTRNSSRFNFTVTLGLGGSVGGGGGGAGTGTDTTQSTTVEAPAVSREATQDELLMHMRASLMEKLLPDYKENVPNNNRCEIGEWPVGVSKSDCAFNIGTFIKEQKFRYAWFSRTLILAIGIVAIGPSLFSRTKVET